MNNTKVMMSAFAVFVALICCACSSRPLKVSSSEMEMLPVDSLADALQDSDYLSVIQPVKENMEKQLNIKIGYAPHAMVRNRPECDLMNWASDALAECARLHYDGNIDLAVVNMGGLRCDWSEGDITFRSVFELMPFDNELVILTMSGENIIELAENCVTLGGQGISKEMRVVGINGHLESVLVSGQPVNPQAIYHVATSDYLSGGADGITALTKYSDRLMTGKKIRDLYIDYIAQTKTVTAEIDGRMTLIEE